MSSAVIRKQITSGARGLVWNKTVNGSLPVYNKRVSVAKALVSSLTTRTDNTSGTLTVTANTITTGQRLDLYWAGGSRHGVVAGTVSGNSVPISAGGGTNLPVATTAIQVSVALQVTDFDFIGDNIQFATFQSQARGKVCPTVSGGADGLVSGLFSSGCIELDINQLWEWINMGTNLGWPNPFAGATLTDVYLSHNDTTKARTFSLAIVSN